MADHENCCHPGDDSLEAFIERNAVLILKASRRLAYNPDRQDAAIFAATRYLMRYPDRVRNKVGNDPVCQGWYWFKAMLTNAFQYDQKEARYNNLMCPAWEESWLDAVAEPVYDSADAALARIALQREENRLQQEMDGAKLAPRERQVYVLRKVLKMSYQEIANELDISKTRVKTAWDLADGKIAEFQMKDQHVIEA
jgi:RNA polymerase sigma factor (sigma-70 family)